MPFQGKTKAQSHYNARAKFDCHGELVELVVFPEEVFNPEKYELLEDNASVNANVCSGSAEASESAGEWLTESAQRARKRVKDLIYSNEDLRAFVTLTLDKSKVNRYDYKQVIAKYNDMLSNMVQRRGLKYVLVPELHKDGAIHFHGFTNNVLGVKKSGKVDKTTGSPIYNITEYKFGFSTLTYIDENRQACANYILKYITKQQGCGKVGGRFYLHGGKLNEPRCVYFTIDPDKIALPDTKIRGGLSCKLWTPERAFARADEYPELTFSGVLTDAERIYQSGGV